MGLDLNNLEPFGQDVGFGYLDRTLRSPRQFNPHLVLNRGGDSMLRALRHELRHASSFAFSVAFVSSRAIALLKQEFIDFDGVGRIITSNYLGFNSPRAFSELLNLRQLGIDVRLHPNPAFHPKGYVFNRTDAVTAILGSSNLTESAIASNHEWNLRVSATLDSDLAAQFTNLLDEELFESVPLTQEWIDEYALTYRPPARPTTARGGIPDGWPTHDVTTIVPNSMQVAALRSIARVRDAGNVRALVISATGTGKTILSALDVKAVDPKRLLFIAHREQIVDRAIREFQEVLGAPESDFGKLAGTSKQLDRRFVFATVQTLSQPHVLGAIDPGAFDYILIDEVHRAGASSFDRVIGHFTPKFMLGMTATPERGDGVSVFEMFDYNVAYEIRLKTALELDMLAPFHYYGVADITFEDGLTTTEATPLMRLVGAERVEHIVAALELYGQAGVSPRGLIFCSRREEAHALSAELNRHHVHGSRLRTTALTGEDSIETRERVVEKLEHGDLDYILTVDIFNEGVDIPTINQVVMLRQTQSSIVFVQQLGRGLRKAAGKEYLVVIDFIGNYANNFLIPIALFGDDSLNKESLRQNLISAEEVGVIAGLSSVRFDRIAQERVLRSLTTSRLDSLHNLKIAIETIRNRVGRIPVLADFIRFESVDPILLATSQGNYPELLAKLFSADTGMSTDESLYLSLICRELLTAKRPHELLLLQHLIERGSTSAAALGRLYKVDVSGDDAVVASAIRSLTLSFNTESELKSFSVGAPAVFDQGFVTLVPEFQQALQNPNFRESIVDVIITGLAVIAERYRPELPFTPGMQYSRKDSSRLLNWSKNMYSTIYGYRVDPGTKTCPIFITLHKSAEVSASTAYEDTLLDPATMLWYSKSNRLITSSELAPIIGNDVALHVFAKKDDAEGSDFYYLGRARARDAEQSSMSGEGGKQVPVVRMKLGFEAPISTALFDYFRPDVTE